MINRKLTVLLNGTHAVQQAVNMGELAPGRYRFMGGNRVAPVAPVQDDPMHTSRPGIRNTGTGATMRPWQGANRVEDYDPADADDSTSFDDGGDEDDETMDDEEDGDAYDESSDDDEEDGDSSDDAGNTTMSRRYAALSKQHVAMGKQLATMRAQMSRKASVKGNGKTMSEMSDEEIEEVQLYQFADRIARQRYHMSISALAQVDSAATERCYFRAAESASYGDSYRLNGA